MTISDKLSEYRFDISADKISLPDNVWLRWYNEWRDKLIDTIINKKEDYFYSYINTETIIWQNEYTFPKRWDLARDWVTKLDWLQKIKELWRKLKSTDTDFSKIKVTNMNNLDQEIDNYKNTSIPFFCIMDNSIFIYPTPTEITPLRIHWIFYPKKLELTDIETIQDQYSDVIMLYVKYKYLWSQKDINWSQFAKNEFETELNRIAIVMSGRIDWPIVYELPDLEYLT